MQTVELVYEEFGNQHPIPLIILHGFFASSRNWRKIAEKLASQYHVLVPDLRNHGNSPHHKLMDYPSMVADVLRFMETKRLTTAHFIGHSMGGKIAMWLALNHPERMNKLVVVDIAPKSYQHSFNKMIQALLDLPLEEINNRKQAEAILKEDIPGLEYRQFLLQNLILKDDRYSWRINLETFMHTAVNIVAFPETLNLTPYQGEALFVAGESSAYLVLEDIISLFPRADFRKMAGAGHWLHVQQPEVFVDWVEKFLQ